MIDKYIVLKRKPKIIVRLFILNIIFLTGLIIWCINTVSYQNFFHIHSKVLNLNSYYFLKVLIPVKEVNEITNQKTLWINNKMYYYKVIKQDNKIIYKEHKNYQTIYLEVKNLEKKYKINNYHLELKIAKKPKKIIKYLHNREEYNEEN